MDWLCIRREEDRLFGAFVRSIDPPTFLFLRVEFFLLDDSLVECSVCF